MAYYHVYIEHLDRSKRTREAYELDFSKEGLEEAIVKPYHTGQPFICDGQPIDSFSICGIMVTVTEKPSHELIPTLVQQEKTEMERSSIGWMINEKYLVVNSGNIVTREFIKHPPNKETPTSKVEVAATRDETPNSPNIFIVYGKDEGMQQSVARVIEILGLKPIILPEQPNKGNTIIEKFQACAKNVSYAIVLLSPDDFAYPEGEMENVKARARQNVILELGYFVGKLGRPRVFTLYKENKDFEMPSDLHGVVYIKYDDANGHWRFALVKELNACGYKVDANKLL